MIWSSIVAVALASEPTPADQAWKMLEGMDLVAETTMINPGKGPRRLLVQKPVPGSEQHLETRLEQTMAMGMSMGGETQSVPSTAQPVVVMRQTHRVGQAAADGAVPVNVEMVDIRLEGGDPAMADAMRAGLEPMRGLDFRAWIAADGAVRQIDVDPSVDEGVFQAVQGMADQFTNQLPAFPAEPVGVGASWTVRTDINMGGMEMITNQTLTITSITDSAVELDVTMSMNKGDGPVNIPGLPPEAKIDISRLEGVGKGTMRVHLKSLVVEQDMTMDADMAMKADMAGMGAFTMDMQLDQHTTAKLVK